MRSENAGQIKFDQEGVIFLLLTCLVSYAWGKWASQPGKHIDKMGFDKRVSPTSL